MNTAIPTLVEARQLMINTATLLRRRAASETAAKTSRKTKPALEETRVRSTFEDMASVGLAKKADIDKAVEAVMADPNTMCDVIRNVGTIAVTKAASAEAENPGELMPKVASADRNPRAQMSQRFAEAARNIAAAKAAKG